MWSYNTFMIAIRAIFVGKTFVPQQPVSLPDCAEALVIRRTEGPFSAGGSRRRDSPYYEGGADDAEDAAWGNATTQQSPRNSQAFA
jgi:hypothetical protein